MCKLFTPGSRYVVLMIIYFNCDMPRNNIFRALIVFIGFSNHVKITAVNICVSWFTSSFQCVSKIVNDFFSVMPQSWHKYFQWWLMNVISHILTLNYSERHGRMERILVLNVLYLMLWLIYPLLRMWKVYSGWTFLNFRLFDHFCRIKIKVFSSFHKNIFIDSFLCLVFEWNSVS